MCKISVVLQLNKHYNAYKDASTFHVTQANNNTKKQFMFGTTFSFSFISKFLGPQSLEIACRRMQYISRRSPVLSQYGIASSSQPIVSAIGQQILKYGGNAADACVAMNMALAVVEPSMTGLGGDCFALYYNSSDKKVYGLNGSGHSPSQLTIDIIEQKLSQFNQSSLDPCHALNVTVPGNVAGTLAFHKKFGTLSRELLFEPAINCAEKGFGVSEVNASCWELGIDCLTGNNLNIDNRSETSYGRDLLLEKIDEKTGKLKYVAPKMGYLFKNPRIGRVLRYIARDGEAAFYDTKHESGIGKNIIDVIQKNGGVMTSEDLLNNHRATFVEPVCINYKNKVKIWEIPPNGQGIAALMALNFYQNSNVSKIAICNKTSINDKINELHNKIECMRLSFRYSRELVGDLTKSSATTTISKLNNYYLSKKFGQECYEKEIFKDKINTNTLIYGGFPIDSR